MKPAHVTFLEPEYRNIFLLNSYSKNLLLTDTDFFSAVEELGNSFIVVIVFETMTFKVFTELMSFE